MQAKAGERLETERRGPNCSVFRLNPSNEQHLQIANTFSVSKPSVNVLQSFETKLHIRFAPSTATSAFCGVCLVFNTQLLQNKRSVALLILAQIDQIASIGKH